MTYMNMRHMLLLLLLTTIVLKNVNTFLILFSKMVVFRAEIHKTLANREDPDETASGLGLHCLTCSS